MRVVIIVLLILAATTVSRLGNVPAAMQPATHTVQAGDTWTALALRYGVSVDELQAANPHFNKARQPAIGREIDLPDHAVERSGTLIRTGGAGVLEVAALHGLPVWEVARLNSLESPYRPTFYRPLLLPGDGTIRDLPPGMTALELSSPMASPGRALGLRGTTTRVGETITANLDGLPVSIFSVDNRFAGIVGTGAFYRGGEPELTIQVGDAPAWVQPWAFAEREWEYQELTLTGQAAEIDQQARDEERARLREIWTAVTPQPLWSTQFETPLNDVLGITANYGARRSYNGGPYLTYHEGVDFSAYGGTPVYAPAAGTVVLAEPLYVRGGTVIIDHGIGLYSGYYHLSAVHATAGQTVQPGDLLGEVGTTGLSTGNHLHWDLLVNGIWVDAAAWQQDGLACWLLEGIGRACLPPSEPE